ncbi:hypothetical protein KVR01_011699 [Diaporthe batatas]|uniref:uncharacterized protein n=1 Tax=Diaporthe batatas TaxID=748121 RepID=UPI001D057D0A|nr:uncharacterized protein KVR01_011699 [Diaporthe batatas]KAG8158577.1 hypothetical protein KVR01_011699 [Diaporthe batatas]
MASSSSTPLCKVCEDPLVTQPDEDDAGEAPAPDDLELPCGCHYHWQCLLDQAGHIALALTCPSCDKYLPTNEAGPSVTNPVFHTPQHQTTIRTRYASEGGVEEDFDILPTLTEEAYLESHPEERRPRAFHTLCGEGDVLGAVELLSDAAADEGAQGGDVAAILSYRDPLARGRSALHLALERGQEDAVWLLLFLGAPRLPLDAFPQEALDAARGMGIGRMPERRGEDLRALRDDDGRAPEDYARALPEVWGRLVGAGVLRP